MLLVLATLGCRNKDYIADTAVVHDSAGLTLPDDLDGDGFDETEDCDDQDPAVFPDAEELCNDIDDDCDGEIDEDDATDAGTWYRDADEDGFGDSSVASSSCEQPSGTADNGADCDDLDPNTYPEAAERCDEVDNDCDGEVDEDVTELWYEDSDNDGWGGEATLDACDPPEGYSARTGDCDDTSASVNPDGTEVCNDVDDDCDGDTDEDAVDFSTWYEDGDSDGFGSENSVEACDAPSGYVDDDTDCDDGDPAVNPDAAEVCNDIDDDCNDWIDDEDPGLTDGETWYIDYDSDGYGDGSFSAEACDAPSGYVDNTDDCDDTDADVWPGADEYCNGIDDDCDGDTDEDSALDVTTWYEDADSDGYGNASVSDDECDQPRGFVEDDTDCDDTDADTYPGARERYDGVDNDCDGDVDDAHWTGSGSDGALSVSSDTNLHDSGDIVSWPVSAISGSDVTVDGTLSGLAAGDEVLLINLHGSDSSYTNVGAYEFGEVDSVTTTTITLTSAVSSTYGESSNADLTDQTVLVQRVPNYTDVTITGSSSLSVDAWDGESGGILALRATGTVSVESGSSVSVSELGYEAGATGTSYNCDSYQGESYAGEGDGDGDGACSAYNESYGHWINNYGGGGAHITGAGGEYAGGATDGDSWTGGSATAPYAGDTYGSADLSTLFFGSGGGGVWRGTTTPSGGTPGPGGDGAGMVYIAAFEIEVDDADGLLADGGSTDNAAQGTWTYGAGGGAGGSIFLVADAMTLATDALSAAGGDGETTHTRLGGDGGVGRIRLDYNELNTYAEGSSDASTAEADACDPDPGYSTTP
ncbi:MAG TPA: putative metal-binding motif-containing protein [Myxococcota bacterium]|nr:putative metal-binding motif-containing protein [Myxococcota bacterium]